MNNKAKLREAFLRFYAHMEGKMYELVELEYLGAGSNDPQIFNNLYGAVEHAVAEYLSSIEEHES